MPELKSAMRRAAWTLDRSGSEWIEAFLVGYLNNDHRRQIDDGCPLAALVSEVSRADEAVKASFEAMVRELESKLASQIGWCGSADAKERALVAVALCVGGLGLARAVRDEGYAKRIIRVMQETGHEDALCRRAESREGRAAKHEPGIVTRKRL